MSLELCPWKFLSEERLREFLSDPRNNAGALDRKIVIDYIKEHFDKHVKFLDVGSGTGHQYLALKKSGMGFEYLGVDKTEKMVEFARKRFPAANFAVGDIYKLPFPDRSWDVVYVRHVLTHLPGYEKALGGVARVADNSLIICLLYPLADRQQIRVEGGPPDQTKPGEFSEHYLNIYARGPFMETLKSFGFNVVMDKLVEVGGYFGKYELIIGRREKN